MQRRDFIKFAGAGVGSALFPAASSSAASSASLPVQPVDLSQQKNKWNSYRLTYQVDLPEQGKIARLWLPLPDTADIDHQLSQGSVWSGNAAIAGLHTLAGTDSPVFHAEWRGCGPRSVTVSSVVKTMDRFTDLCEYSGSAKETIPAEMKRFLKPTRHIPLDGIVRKTALSIIKADNARSPKKKARAIYDWVVDNAHRDQATRGCGRGDIKSMLETGNLGGKCADLNALFVGLTRAVGIPARDRYGIRIDESTTFKSLGKLGDISKAQHCRAEFYLAGLGWVPVDPADVRKAVLEENLPLDDTRIIALREKLFGAWEMNWVAFNHAEDVVLARDSVAGRLPFFMYPHAEIGGQQQDSLEPAQFVYSIVSAELVGTGAQF